MRHGVRTAPLVCGLLTVAGLAAPAGAQALTLTAGKGETGWIGLAVPDAGAATRVTLAEQTGAAQQPLADAAPTAGQLTVRHAAGWRCDRLERTFVATATYPDGSAQTATASLRTPSCRNRLMLVARQTRGTIRVRAADRWKLGGVTARSCVNAPGRRPACRTLAIPAGSRDAGIVYHARSSGLWSVALSTAWGQHVARGFYVRPRRRLRLLATGDSMIQVLDSYLKDRLAPRDIAVRSDARVSTGLSKPFLLNWPRLAQKQARGIRPDVTVVFVGANDGFPFGDVSCCSDAWVDQYARRARAMMRAYARGGRGLVYWLTLPAPRPPEWRPIYPAVNRAIKHAAAAVGGVARVLDIAKTFTPNYRFRKTMVWRGRPETVRQSDGVHLSPPGASIAATLIEHALHEDGVL